MDKIYIRRPTGWTKVKLDTQLALQHQTYHVEEQLQRQVIGGPHGQDAPLAVGSKERR